MIKRIFYRDTTEMIILVCLALICAPLTLFVSYPIGIIYIFVLIAMILLDIWNAKINKDKIFFWCKHSILNKKKVWIVQKMIIINKNNSCPRRDIAKEMLHLLDNLPSETTCYCCTHEVIKKHIEKIFSDVETTPIYRKNIKNLKKMIKSKKCKSCSNKKNCPISKGEKTQFYAIKIRL